MPAAYEWRFLFALALTLLIEVPALFLLARFGLIRDKPMLFLAGAGMLASLLTLPYVWFVIPAFASGVGFVVAAEAFAVIAETVLYSFLLSIPLSRAFVLSFLCNLASYAIGGFVLARF